MIRAYLDVCCLNRITDDQTQPRIRQEAEAVERILGRIRTGEIEWVSSEAIVDEIENNPDVDRRIENATLLTLASETVEVDIIAVRRASALAVAGYGAYDALHLACAEAAGADVLLTTDDRFVRLAARRVGQPAIPVRNPLFWIQGSLP